MFVSKTNRIAALVRLAEIINAQSATILEANQLDLNQATNLDATLQDRLKLDRLKLLAITESLTTLANSDMLEGSTLYQFTHKNGIQIQNTLVPFGRILIIYESRPDVTIEAAAAAFFSGNTIWLKGGKEARNTNLALMQCWALVLQEFAIDPDYVAYLDMNRAEMQQFLDEHKKQIDLIIPRGGQQLINEIKQKTDIPLLISGRGNNFLYVHSDADLKMAEALILDGKSRLSVCNAIDKVLINRKLPKLDKWLVALISKLQERQVVCYNWNLGLIDTNEALKDASKDMWKEEFLAAKLMLALVVDLPEACSLINAHSGKHSAVIVSESDIAASHFLQQVDAASVLHNASSRFTDGGQFGFGAEIAISTQKSHARGPVGPNQLLTNKWFTKGNGQTRV